MATHASREEPTPASLPDVVPFDLRYLSRQSWALGSRTVDDASREGEWRHDGDGWTLTAFDATEETLLLRLRTPVGRCRFYGTTKAEFREARPVLSASPEWESVDD